MKRKFIVVFLVLTLGNIYAQGKKYYTIRTLVQENTINPEFYGGLDAFYKYISDNLAFGHVTENVSEIITMRFSIDTDGKVTNIKTIKDSKKSFFKFGKQITKILKKSPQWIPGKINNVVAPITLEIDIPINIRITHYEDAY